jgi:hypothetical protein
MKNHTRPLLPPNIWQKGWATPDYPGYTVVKAPMVTICTPFGRFTLSIFCEKYRTQVLQSTRTRREYACIIHQNMSEKDVLLYTDLEKGCLQ